MDGSDSWVVLGDRVCDYSLDQLLLLYRCPVLLVVVLFSGLAASDRFLILGRYRLILLTD